MKTTLKIATTLVLTLGLIFLPTCAFKSSTAPDGSTQREFRPAWTAHDTAAVADVAGDLATKILDKYIVLQDNHADHAPDEWDQILSLLEQYQTLRQRPTVQQ